MFTNTVCSKLKNHQNIFKKLTSYNLISSGFILKENKNINYGLLPVTFTTSNYHVKKALALSPSSSLLNRKDYYEVNQINKNYRYLTSNSLVVYASKPNQLIEDENNHPKAIDSIKQRQEEIEKKRIEKELIEALKNDRFQKILVSKTPKSIEPYIRLMRWDKPAAIFLCYWPSSWAILGAASYQGAALPDFYMLALFAVGALAMRTSGCIINDIWDRKIDRQVERTKNRPLASGEIGVLSAMVLLGTNLSVALSILLQLNLTTQVLGACCLFPVAIYPAAKRFTEWPQAILGLTFNWGALMGWSTVMCNGLAVETQNIFSFLPAVALYAACINWTLFYDTIYAYPDKDFDSKLGLRSTTITTQKNPRKWLLAFSGLCTSNLAIFGYLTHQEPIYYITLGLAGAHFLKQIIFVNYNSPESCYKQFKSNNTIGGLIAFGLLSSLLIR